MDILQAHKSGILKKGEDICEHIEGTIKNKNNFDESDMLVITNKRFLFLKKPGFFSKGLNVIFALSL